MFCDCSFSKEFLPKLFITKDGRVISTLRNNRTLKTQLSKKGYPRVRITSDRIKYTFNIHRLVAENFISNTENKSTINHKDGNKLNNHISNLEWMTNTENMRHAFDTGIRKGLQGEDNTSAKLTEIQAKDIIFLLENTDARHWQISKMFNVSRSCITDINNNKTWKNLHRKGGNK